MKEYRRFIRINGKLKKSPPFKRASDGERWYQERVRERQLLKEGLSMPLDIRTSLNMYFYSTWLPRRQREYSKATWGADEQRYRKYVEPTIGPFKISKISTLLIRNCLTKVTQAHDMSVNTRNHVRSLLSKIFGDSMLEERPLRTVNPALGMKFKDPRRGVRKPEHISNMKDVEAYLSAARGVSAQCYAIACSFIMSGPRKSELIALKWKHFDDTGPHLLITSRYVQAEKKIIKGTKSGSEEHRLVSVPDALLAVLNSWRNVSNFSKENDFIFTRRNGTHLNPREINTMLERVSNKSGVKASPHALRHSFGRWFVANGGTTKSLQTFLGHSSSQTTEVYSVLAGEQVKHDRNRVSFEVGK